MPYKIFAINKNGEVIGYKVGKKDRSIMANGRRYLSNKPLSKKKAVAQLRAVGISESMGSPIPVRENKLNFLITAPYSYCNSEEDEFCHKNSGIRAKELFKKMIGKSPYVCEDDTGYTHKRFNNINLLIPKIHKSQCDLLKEDCSSRSNFVSKMDQLANENGLDKTVVINVHTFPKGDKLDSSNGGHMVMTHPKGRELHTLMLKDIFSDIFKKNPVVMEEKERNLLHERYIGSPLVVSLHYPDYD